MSNQAETYEFSTVDEQGKDEVVDIATFETPADAANYAMELCLKNKKIIFWVAVGVACLVVVFVLFEKVV